ncbi:MAG: M56 family metallopeptidase, partial [Gemmatimonadota bacterium]
GVRVAPAAGPAVMGLRCPEIVVPAWLLEASPEEQRLVVLHEREHLRAGVPCGCPGRARRPGRAGRL